MGAHVRVHGNDGDLFDNSRNVGYAGVDKVSDRFKVLLLIFFDSLLLLESDKR